MSGNERKRQKRGDQKEESRRKSGDASDNVANSENTTSSISHPHLSKLPAVVWGKHIAPFLHRKDLNNLLAQGGKEIYEACRDLKFPWPTVDLCLPGVLDELDSHSSEVEVLRAISPDSKWIFAAPVIGKRTRYRNVYHWTGLYVFHSRYGRAKDAVPLPGRPRSSSPNDFQQSVSQYYPKQISISKDGRYLVVSYEAKIEVDVFRITFHEESKAPSVSLELHRTFELDTTAATSPFKFMRHSCRLILSTNSKWAIVGYVGDPAALFSRHSAVVAWDIETGAIVKSEVGTRTLHPSHVEIVATDSMILWRQNNGAKPIVIRAWTIENEELSSEEPIHWSHPDNDVARRKLYSFVKVAPSPVDPSTFIVFAEETQETHEGSQGPVTKRHPLDLLKLIPSTEEGGSTTVQKLRRLDHDIPHYYASMSIGWYRDGQHCLLFEH